MGKMKSRVIAAMTGLVVCLALEPVAAHGQENASCPVPNFSNATIVARSGHNDGISPASYFEIETNNQTPRTIAISIKREDAAGPRLKRYYLTENSLVATMSSTVEENSGTLTDEVFDCSGQKIGAVSETGDGAAIQIRNANGDIVATGVPSSGFLWGRDNRLELRGADGGTAAVLVMGGVFSNSAHFSIPNPGIIDPRLAVDFAILGIVAQGQRIPRL